MGLDGNLEVYNFEIILIKTAVFVIIMLIASIKSLDKQLNIVLAYLS